MESTCKLLGSYAGREKVMRTAAYAAMFVAGAGDGNAKRRAGILSTQLNSARTILRLFDDVPMLAFSLKYGTGAQEKDLVKRCLSLVCNAANQLYFPVEHIAWAADQKLIQISSSRWWTAGIALWAISLLSNILRSLRTISLLGESCAKLRKQRNLESPDKSDKSDISFKQATSDLQKQQINELLNVIKNISDFLNAINWLPKGFLWSGKLSLAQAGICGTISSLIGLYQIFPTK